MTDTSNCTSVTPECPVEATSYGYTPNLGGNLFLAILFGLCGVYSLAIGIKSRQWTFTIALAGGCFIELTGYIGRILMHSNPWSAGGFDVQIVCLIVAPSFIAAGIYWSLKHIVLYLGPEKSRLPPRFYPRIFIGCDIASILIQAAGGGIAVSASDNDNEKLDAGNNLMIAGIAFQVATMAICGLLGADFAFRVYREGRSPRFEEKESKKEALLFKSFCAGEVFAYITVLIRCIYRLPEMAEGWANPLMRNETEFMILDGVMVALAVVALTVLHPYFTCPFV
ncbi:RTA1 domain protein, partial [Penicillium sp. IBT 18751x]